MARPRATVRRAATVRPGPAPTVRRGRPASTRPRPAEPGAEQLSSGQSGPAAPTPPAGYGYGQPGGYGSGGYGPGGYGPGGGYGSGGGYGGYGGYGRGGFPPPPSGYGPPGDYIDHGPPRRRLTGLVAYIAVAAVAAAAGAGTVLLANVFDHQSGKAAAGQASRPFHPSLGQPRAGGSGSGSGRSPVSSATEHAVYNKVQPGLVDITSNLGFQGGTAAATGMVITKSGLVLTNNHVINGTTGMKATVVATGQSYAAKFLGYDKNDDVAVLQLYTSSGAKPDTMRTVPLGNSTKVSLGDGVVALGNAGGTGSTETVTGTITGLNQTITASDDGSGTSERLTGMLRTNANIVPGDSGGPLVSTDGQVIGMDTAAATGSFGVGQQDVGFAIPINRALRIANEIISGRGSPSVQIGSEGFLGVLVPAKKASTVSSPSQQRSLQIQEDQNPTSPGVPKAGAACVPNSLEAGIPARVAPASSGTLVLGELCGTAAAKAGIIAGDVITAVNGQTVTTPNSLTGIMAKFRPGSHVKLSIRRGVHRPEGDQDPDPRGQAAGVAGQHRSRKPERRDRLAAAPLCSPRAGQARSNSPSCTPAVNARHSSGVNSSTGPSGLRLSRMAMTCSLPSLEPGRMAISTQASSGSSVLDALCQTAPVRSISDIPFLIAGP